MLQYSQFPESHRARGDLTLPNVGRGWSVCSYLKLLTLAVESTGPLIFVVSLINEVSM